MTTDAQVEAAAGDPKLPLATLTAKDMDYILEAQEAARQQGFAAGTEAAAKWHEQQADEFFDNKSRPAMDAGDEHLRYAESIRALRPAAPAENTCPTCGECLLDNDEPHAFGLCTPPPSASEPAGALLNEAQGFVCSQPEGDATFLVARLADEIKRMRSEEDVIAAVVQGFKKQGLVPADYLVREVSAAVLALLRRELGTLRRVVDTGDDEKHA